MHRPRRRNAILMGVAAVLAVASVPSVSAQDAGDVTESLCKLFNKKQVREAFGQQVGNSDQSPGECLWGLVDQGAYGGELTLRIAWEPVAFEDLALVTPDATDLTIAERPARYSVREGQVVAVGEGQVTRDIYSDLILDLESGPLGLHLMDAKGNDRQQTLVGLAELAVAKASRLVAPPPRDDALAALIPATIGGQPTLVERVLFPAREFCSRCDSGKALRSALKGMGKTLADVSLLTASGVDPARAGQQDFRQPAIRALRVAGGDATALVEPVITYLFEGSGVQPERVDGTEVVAVTRPEDEFNFPWTAIVYPQGDTLWVVTAEEPLRSEVLAALPGAPTPPPIPTPAPTPTPDVSTAEGWFRSVLPASVAGERLRIASVAAGDELAQVFPSDVIKQFRAVLKAQDATTDDLSLVLAATASGLAVQGYRIAGGDAAPLVDVLVDLLRQGGVLGKRERPVEAVIGGKTVFTAESAQGTIVMYPGGEVLWVTQGAPTEAATELYAALP